jgi:hypothetical protein
LTVATEVADVVGESQERSDKLEIPDFNRPRIGPDWEEAGVKVGLDQELRPDIHVLPASSTGGVVAPVYLSTP